MIMHSLPPWRRAIAFIFPAIIVVIATLIFPVFIAAGLPWWPVLILAPATVLAGVVCIEFWATAIGFDANGVRYRSVGYQLDVPWSGVQLQTNGDKTILRVTAGHRRFFPWLGIMFNITRGLAPYHSHLANDTMATIPLYFFLTADGPVVMEDLRTASPAGFLQETPSPPRSG